jgi:ACS family D-galactonate transporter-like MFS transporter
MLRASAGGTAGPSAPKWMLLGFLTTAMFFCYVHRGTLAIAAPFMMRDLGLNKASMGVLLSAFFWSYSLVQVPAGWLVDRYGVGRTYAVGFFVWTLAVALTSIPSTIVLLIALRMLLGIGQGVRFQPVHGRSRTGMQRVNAAGLQASISRETAWDRRQSSL